MNKELTAMQMLIEEIDICISNLGSKNDLLTRCQKGRLVDAKTIAKRLLKKEQEQIEQAFESGYSEGLGAGTGIGELKYSDVSYYQSKYVGEDVDR